MTEDRLTGDLLTRAKVGDGEAFRALVGAVPAGAAGALLPDARLGAGRRGRGPGNDDGRVART